MTETPLTAKRLREVLDYNPETGIFMWKEKSQGRPTNRPAGNKSKNIVRIGIKTGSHTKKYLAHRLAWLYTHSEWPTNCIDHINGDSNDNRICNLREATQAENMQNEVRIRKNNTTGFHGVSRFQERFQATITKNYKKIHLGFYPNPELAHAAYLKAKAELHPFSTLGASEITS
jgi:HNH endonuclease